ncbi:hypothetical protein EI94DRAFT_1704339 [Lactarius quietus]|nr:hypothetical protein EI94DRAFT_1704339 [Lactarius quietus]
MELISFLVFGLGHFQDLDLDPWQPTVMLPPARPPGSMPFWHEGTAPTLDLIDPLGVWRYFNDLEFLFEVHHISNEQDKKNAAIYYLSIKLERYWMSKTRSKTQQFPSMISKQGSSGITQRPQQHSIPPLTTLRDLFQTVHASHFTPRWNLENTTKISKLSYAPSLSKVKSQRQCKCSSCLRIDLPGATGLTDTDLENIANSNITAHYLTNASFVNTSSFPAHINILTDSANPITCVIANTIIYLANTTPAFTANGHIVANPPSMFAGKRATLKDDAQTFHSGTWKAVHATADDLTRPWKPDLEGVEDMTSLDTEATIHEALIQPHSYSHIGNEQTVAGS